MSTDRVCSRCIMDSTDPRIRFDEQGMCNHCKSFFHRRSLNKDASDETESSLQLLLKRIKSDGKGKDYDCIIGVSGGLDSTYLLYLAVQWGLRPLAVHLDNGWNSDLAVTNIAAVLKFGSVDLHTEVIDWPEFQSLQRAYLKASVIDIEVPTDQAIHGILYRMAREIGVRHILYGGNEATEGILPRAWNFSKVDNKNLRAIHQRFGTVPLDTFPSFGLRDLLASQYVHKIQMHPLLNYVRYTRQQAQTILEKDLAWKPYCTKHGESVFTRFYQGYILPVKFGIDKRRAHLSTLICSGEIGRDQALAEIAVPAYSESELQDNYDYVIKKLGFSRDEFDSVMCQPPVSHLAYPADLRSKFLYRVYPHLRPLRESVERLLQRELAK